MCDCAFMRAVARGNEPGRRHAFPLFSHSRNPVHLRNHVSVLYSKNARPTIVDLLQGKEKVSLLGVDVKKSLGQVVLLWTFMNLLKVLPKQCIG